MTLSLTPFSIMTPSIIETHHNQTVIRLRPVLFIVMLSVVMLIAVMLNVVVPGTVL
jgi:hypothetical protein